MRSTKTIHVISAHAEGEVGDVIVGGVTPPPGDTIWEQSRWIAGDQTLRNFVLNEPRGGVFRHVNLLVPPKNPEADAAFIIMEPEDTPPMSGSNSICVSTVLLDSGILPMKEPVTEITLEAPGGLVRVRAECRDGKAERIFVQNLPSFADRLDAKLEVEGLGTLTVDAAYGGDSFVVLDAAAMGFSLKPDEAHDIARLGVRITNAANAQLGFHHPEKPRLAAFFLLPLRRSSRTDGGRSAGRRGGRDPAWKGRPFADRHGALGAHGRPACARRNGALGPSDGGIPDRVDLLRPDPGHDRGRRPPRGAAGNLGARLDHRHPSAHARPLGPMAGGLSAERYMGCALSGRLCGKCARFVSHAL